MVVFLPSGESLTAGTDVWARCVGCPLLDIALRYTMKVLHSSFAAAQLIMRSSIPPVWLGLGIGADLVRPAQLPASIPVSTYSICSRLHERLIPGDKT